MYGRASRAVEAFTPPVTLIRGSATLRTRVVTLPAGAVYTLGSVLGEITATKKHPLAASAAADGSQTPKLVLAQTVDATSADVQAIAYESGDFVKEKLIFGAGHTADSAREQLRALNITYG